MTPVEFVYVINAEVKKRYGPRRSGWLPVGLRLKISPTLRAWLRQDPEIWRYLPAPASPQDGDPFDHVFPVPVFTDREMKGGQWMLAIVTLEVVESGEVSEVKV